MSDASKVPILLDLEELDSYPTPVQVKKETPTATSSKPAAVPKPNLKSHTSTSKKRNGSETTTPASSEGFFEELSFTESLEPMTSFLNKLQEARKQLETTIANQGTIAEAKTQHYEDKLKKVTQDVEVKLAAAHVEHDQAMISFQEGIKNSAVVSLLQARMKIAYEAKETSLECPSWPVDSWVAKLMELGGNLVSYPVKAGVGETSKAAEVVDEAGEKKDAGEDAAV
ncbi:hypothetical protein HanOQP8_Chr13g0491861 [Helianthus annuus]|nr:hypothetical protein HanIR_Chr13g0651601 [Helianthus annuus]KAJ0671984.1 hypothetical protein HanOQP8_Chr13g0491861 [Helianthus annuus]